MKIIAHAKIRLDNYTENGLEIMKQSNRHFLIIWPDKSCRNYIFSPFISCTGISIYEDGYDYTTFEILGNNDNLSKDVVIGIFLNYTI